jgi:hypothetical protein
MIEFFQILGAIFGLSTTTILEVADRHCNAAIWRAEPRRIASGRYAAEIAILCEVKPQLGGDYSRLEELIYTQMKERGSFISGPTQEEFMGMPSKISDYVFRYSGQKFDLESRQDVRIANNLVNRMVGMLHTTRVRGTGNAEHIKQVDAQVEVNRASQVGDPVLDRALFIVSGEFTKPWYVPEGVLLSEAKKRGPQEMANLAEQAVQKMEESY